MTPLRLPLLRGPTPVSFSTGCRAALSAVAVVAITGFAAHAAVAGDLRLEPLLAPPIGASAVLICAVPASPLAQPRAVIGGNVLSGLVGLGCAMAIHQPVLAAAVAVGAAILVMLILGCLHPPGGAVALGAALASAPSLGTVVGPVALCSVLLVLASTVAVKLSGRSYPHRAHLPASPHGTHDRPPSERGGYTAADIDAALAQYGELLDVSREDLDALFHQVEIQASRRIHSQIRCEEIMSRDVVALDAHQSCESALAYLRQHDLRVAPVIDDRRRVVGMARRAELAAGRSRPVESVIDPFVHRVPPRAAIETLFPLLSSGKAHEVMVVDADRVLLGVITQTDLLAVLYRAHVVEAVVAGREG
ncbi:MAG: HPP family protein [Phenylobacterium sp.]|uniref:HPP family protein n=1 Tax=Phenylobacterium sp. TaxID=1871053 RepID=UPI0027331B18|nr:HPP family protein [Phenylobacterium sp.]MDP3173005.1 HPP family protein [Phenylobacterium sp.]